MRTLLISIALLSLAIMASGCDKGKGKIETATLANFKEYEGAVVKDLPNERIAVIRNVDTMLNLAQNFSELFKWFLLTQTEVAGYNTAIFAESPARLERTNNLHKLFYYVGLPVPDKVYTSGPVKIYTFMKCRAACMLHYGHHDDLPATYAKLLTWMASNGYEPSGLYREVYVSGPGPNEPADPARWITELVIPIKY